MAMADTQEPVWAEDEDFTGRHPYSRYSWNEAAALVVQNPGKWLLVSDDAPPSTASNVNGGIIKAFASYVLDGWRFTARTSDVYTPDEDHPFRRRGKVWIKAERADED